MGYNNLNDLWGDVKNKVTSTFSNNNLVNDAYKNIAGKTTPDPEGLKYWTDQLNTGALDPSNFNTAFTNSVKDVHNSNANMVRDAYRGIGRVGINTSGETNNSTIDKSGWDYWTNQLNTGALDPSKFNETFTRAADDYNANNPTTGSTVTMPDMSNTNIPSYIDMLSPSFQNFLDAYAKYSELPGEIDEWTANAKNRQRMTGDQVTGIFNKIGNQRAGSGIMGGTEQDNATADLTANLAKIFNDNKSNIELAGNTLKANATAQLPSSAMTGVNALTNLYQINAADQQNWAQLATQIINSTY